MLEINTDTLEIVTLQMVLMLSLRLIYIPMIFFYRNTDTENVECVGLKASKIL